MVDLIIPLRVWQRMNCYADLAAPNEVTGIGTLKKVSNSVLVVEEIFLPNQTATPGECDFSPTGMHEIITDLIEAGTPEKVEWLKFRWHSHGHGSCFFSEKDVRDISQYPGDWVVNIVINVLGDYSVRLDVLKPLALENLPIRLIVEYPLGRKLKENCAAEISEKVRFLRG